MSKVPAVIISEDFFQDYYYALDNSEGDTSMEANTKKTDFYNPETLKRNHWLHAWLVISTSPFANAVCFTQDTPAVTKVTVNPSTSTISAGNQVQLSATVTTTGFANKAVTWDITKEPDKAEHPVTVDLNGLVNIPAGTPTGEANIEVTATSIYDKNQTGKATITVA